MAEKKPVKKSGDNGIPFSVHVREGGKPFTMLRDRGPDKDPQAVCICDKTVDLSLGCTAHVRGEHIEDVIRNNGKYVDFEAMKKAFGSELYAGCLQCYARSWNIGPIKPFTVTPTTRDELMKKVVLPNDDPKHRRVRMGKSVENGHTYHRESLVDFLTLCKSNDVSVIFPTRVLEYDPCVAKLFRETHSVLSYSIANSLLELGPVSQGATPEWRVEEAKKYHEDDVRTNYWLSCDVSASWDVNQKLGYPISQVFEAQEQHGIPLRLIAMYWPSRVAALFGTGRTWEELSGGQQSLAFDALNPFGLTDEDDYIREAPYAVKSGQNNLVIRKVHPDALEFLEKAKTHAQGLETYRACGKMGESGVFCDHCGISDTSDGRGPKIYFPQDQLHHEEEVRRPPTSLTVKGKQRVEDENDTLLKSLE